MKLRRVNFVYLLSFLISGCLGGMGAPIDDPKPIADHEILKSKLGLSRPEIETTFGPPICSFLGPDKRYSVYHSDRKVAGVGFLILPIIPLWGIDGISCTLLEFDSKGRLARFDSDMYNIGFVGMNEPKAKEWCVDLFYSDDEILDLARAHDAEIRQRDIKRWDSNCLYSAPKK